jgi:hypothetical protein
MDHQPAKPAHPLTSFIQVTSWLGVGIWTVSFALTSLQLWLQS